MKPHNRSDRGARRGAALVLAVSAVTVVALMSLAVLQFSSSLSRGQALSADTKRSFYLAEAGLAEAYIGLMTGKTGQVGVREDPAVFGDGLFWVDSTDEPDGSIRLESTGMCGRGRVKLGLVVRWNGESIAALGFFTDGDLLVRPGSLIDGYESSEGAYEDQAKESKVPGGGPYSLVGTRVGSNGDIALLSDDADSVPVEVRHGSDAGSSKGKDKSKELEKIRAEREEREKPEDKKDKEYTDSEEVVKRGRQRQEEGFAKGGRANGRTNKGGESSDDGGERVKAGDKSALKEGGTSVLGEIALQPDSRLELHANTYVEGELASFDEPRELPPIELPDRTLLPAVDHSGSGPLVLSGSSGAYEGLHVRKGARVILTGPSTLVLGEVEVEEGGELVFDTTEGAVVLYVAESFQLEPGSLVSYEERRPDRVEIQVSAVETEGDEPRVRIETDDPLYGLIYSPTATVALGDRAELFGAVVAARLELGRQVRLHYDQSMAESSESDSMPQLRGWEILELGTLGGGRASDPFFFLGVDRSALRMPKDAHVDLWIELKYLDALGIEYRYEGWESDLDWLNVEEILEMKSRKGPDEPVLDEIKKKKGWLEKKQK